MAKRTRGTTPGNVSLKELFKSMGNLVQHPILEALEVSLQDPLNSNSQEEFQKKLHQNLQFLEEKLRLFQDAFSISSEEAQEHMLELMKNAPEVEAQMQAIEKAAVNYRQAAEDAVKTKRFGLVRPSTPEHSSRRRSNWIKCS
jgi:thiaminase